MHQRTRFKLHFGPYKTPSFTYGSTVRDLSRGEVQIVGITAGKIPWPVGQCNKHNSPVLYKDLARAVKKEAAIAIRHWWGVGDKPVARWRKALGVEHFNEGNRRLGGPMDMSPGPSER